MNNDNSVFGFLKTSCARCGTQKPPLYKISDTKWLCLECLKEGEYKESWNDIKTNISGKYNVQRADNNEIYEKLISDADEILNLKISLENDLITKAEYNERLKVLFKI